MFIAHVFKILATVGILLMPASFSSAQPVNGMNFLGQQEQFPRVRDARRNKADALARKMDTLGLKGDDLNILIVAYKAEAYLEVYAKSAGATRYERLVSYPICAASGTLGPKRRQGDRQVPEGFYRINRFNPASNYHLSLGLNYPNAADKLKTRAADPGGDIFIHGSCVTIGCLPMTDAGIEEIYLYAVYARSSGQKEIPVYIFPFRMTAENMEKYGAAHAGNQGLVDFWKNIKPGYDKFMSDAKALVVGVTPSGDYRFEP